jgi:hypothetical protein
MFINISLARHAIAHLVEELCYKTKVAGSIYVEVIGFFNLPDPSGGTKPLGLTQPLR